MSAEPALFLSAGEPSGDRYAGALARELSRRRPDLRLLGMGGARMRAAGVETLAGLDRLAVMGTAELVSRVPFFLRLRRRVRSRLVREDVRLVVAVNYPGFNLPLASFAGRRGVPVLYYAPPQVWAWRRGRARRLAEAADLVCAILPFERETLAAAGAEVEFVGHPLLDDVDADPAPARDRRSDGVESEGEAGSGSRLGLFPGSRRQEVRRLLPPMLDAARRLRRSRPPLDVAVARAPAVPRPAYGEVPSGALRPAAEVARRSTAAVAASGTVTLELALHGTPMVVAYRMHPVSFALARELVRVDHVSLVNLVHGSSLVPELLQGGATGEAMARSVAPLLEPGGRRREVRRGLRRVRGRLGRPGVAGRVADRALRLLDRRRPAA